MRQSTSFAAVGLKPPGGSGSVEFGVSSGQVNLVEGMAPMPRVEAKSSRVSVISTWSPAKGAEGPISALKVLPFRRTCQEEVGSAAGVLFIAGMLWKAKLSPHGQISTIASGLIAMTSS